MPQLRSHPISSNNNNLERWRLFHRLGSSMLVWWSYGSWRLDQWRVLGYHLSQLIARILPVHLGPNTTLFQTMRRITPMQSAEWTFHHIRTEPNTPAVFCHLGIQIFNACYIFYGMLHNPSKIHKLFLHHLSSISSLKNDTSFLLLKASCLLKRDKFMASCTS